MLAGEVTYRPATAEDVANLLPRLRAADIDECEALTGKGSLTVSAHRTFFGASMAWTAEIDGTPEAMFGVSGLILSGIGHPWMFGTDAIGRNSRALITQSGPYIQRMLEIFPRLENVVDARNVKSIRWLKRVGFKIRPAVRMGVAGLPFHPFDMEV